MNFTMAVDYYDMVAFSDDLFDEDRINRFMGECVENGVDALQWRVSVCGKLFYHTRTPDGFTAGGGAKMDRAYATLHRPIYDKCEEILKRFDPLEVAVEYAGRHGLAIQPWLTLYDDYGYGLNISSLMVDHPEYSWSSVDGRLYLGLASYVYPEVVEFRMRQIRELIEYGGDGLYLSNRSHSRPQEYFRALDLFSEKNPEKEYTEWIKANTELIDGMQRDAVGRYGFDLPAVNAFCEKHGIEPEDDLAAWWRFRGGYFSRFISKVAAELNESRQTLSFGLRYAPLNAMVYGNRFFDWRGLGDEKIFDQIHYLLPGGVDKRANEVFDEIDSTDFESYAWLWLGNMTDGLDAHINVSPVLKAIEEGSIDGVTLFEAYRFESYPSLWNIIKRIQGN